jgi:cobalt-zinc-cadmium efflux system protein
MSSDHAHNHDHGHAHDHGHGHAHDHGHGHDHGRGHTHGHGHSHAPKDFGAAFAIGAGLNFAFVVAEAAFGVIGHSMALLADAGHNLSDVLSLLVAWGAAVLARRQPKGRYTYGLRGSSILAALFNAVFLLVVIGGIATETVRRFFEPSPVQGWTVIVVAAIGILINTATALMFMRGRENDLNVRGAFLHMTTDAAVSAGVVVTGFAILLTGWAWLDPLVSLAILAVIVAATWGLLKDSVDMGLHAAPPGIDPGAVEAFLLARPGVASVHDLHVWPMSTTETALTAHLLIPAGYPGDDYTVQICAELNRHFGIGHATLQIETSPTSGCTLEPAHVV